VVKPCAMPTKGCKGSYKKWKQVTPAMAAGLTDHVWTMDELLSFRVPPKSLWKWPFTRYRDTTQNSITYYFLVGYKNEIKSKLELLAANEVVITPVDDDPNNESYYYKILNLLWRKDGQWRGWYFQQNL
jgi:hypothetical protein